MKLLIWPIAIYVLLLVCVGSEEAQATQQSKQCLYWIPSGKARYEDHLKTPIQKRKLENVKYFEQCYEAEAGYWIRRAVDLLENYADPESSSALLNQAEAYVTKAMRYGLGPTGYLLKAQLEKLRGDPEKAITLYAQAWSEYKTFQLTPLIEFSGDFLPLAKTLGYLPQVLASMHIGLIDYCEEEIFEGWDTYNSEGKNNVALLFRYIASYYDSSSYQIHGEPKVIIKESCGRIKNWENS